MESRGRHAVDDSMEYDWIAPRLDTAAYATGSSTLSLI